MRIRSIPMLLLLSVTSGVWAEYEPANVDRSAHSTAWPQTHFPFGEPAVIEDIDGAGQLLFHRIAGSNFTPRGSTTTYSYTGGGCMQRNSNDGDSWFTTDIQVPDGATIDFLRVYYNDADASFDINTELWAFDAAGGTTLIAEADSSGSPGYSSAGSDFFAHVVDNLNQSLVIVASIQAGVGANLALCGVRIRYQMP